MNDTLRSLSERLAPAEEIFFTWLLRVFLSATLIGMAWIDDAPPLELAALIIAVYTGLRVLMQFGTLLAVAPFKGLVPRGAFAVVSLLLLVMAFPAVAIFAYGLAEIIVS